MLLGASAAWTALASPIPIINHSFEDIVGEFPSGEFTFGPFAGWDVYDPGSVTNGGAGPNYYVGTLTPFEPDPIGDPGVYANFPAGAPDGERVAIAFNFFGTGDGGEYGLMQTLNTTTLQSNTYYQLQVDIGNIASAQATSGQFFNLDGFPGYRVDLLAGENIVAQDNNTLAGSIAEGEFGLSTVNLITGTSHPQLGETLSIRLVNLNITDPNFPDADLEVDFDNVRLEAAAIPEPRTILFLLSICIPLLLLRNRLHTNLGTRRSLRVPELQ